MFMYKQSEEFNNKIYNMDWTILNSKAKKSIFIMMEYSKRPMRVQCGKFVVLSLETFIKVSKFCKMFIQVKYH